MTHTYIYQHGNWPDLTWDSELLSMLLLSVRHSQGRLLGYMEALGFGLQTEAQLEILTADVIKTSEIEGEILNPQQVRSSIARRLGLNIAGLIPSDRHVDGVVEMMLDATQHFNKPLSAVRLFGWHTALFPDGKSGLYRITTGQWRDDSNGPMQVVSGGYGNEMVHFEAPPANSIDHEMERFLTWFNTDSDIDPVMKAAIAHFWFITIHPFEDGNGRIARAITDMQLARADGSAQRFYSMSAQIQKDRNTYYAILERSQKGPLDITLWLQWFLQCMEKALTATDVLLFKVVAKAKFWDRFATAVFNGRQTIMLNKLLDDFEGKLTTAKWAKMAKCSHDTALRDIQDLVDKGALFQDEAGGRSTSYLLTTQ